MSEPVGVCGCRLERTEYGLKMVDCPLHASAGGLLKICKEFLPMFQALRCSLKGNREAEKVMSMQKAESIREVEETLRQIIEQAEGRE